MKSNNRTSITQTVPLQTKMQLEAADTILRYLASFLNDEADEAIINEIHNAVADYAERYWPDGPKINKI